MWEYWRKEIKFKFHSELTQELNRDGINGWEIVYYMENNNVANILYKRIKHSDL